MQDRVSLYPGRVKLTPISGQENTYDMVRADEPTQEGTPLNKATLLKDATAALLGLDDNAVPDDALITLYGMYHTVASFKQLWENANLGSSFEPQTLNINSTGYQLLLLIIENMKCFFVRKSNGSAVSFNMTGHYVEYTNSDNGYLRSITINDNSIVFGDSWYRVNYQETTTNNNLLKPAYIFGIKGVQM